MRLFPLLMAALVVTGLYFWIVEGSDAQEGAEPAPAAAATETHPVKVVAFRSEARPVASAILMRGRTEAMTRVAVRAETSGLVISEPLRAGAQVSVGEVLCQLDPGSREAQLTEAKARLAQARSDYDAAQQLSQKGYASQTSAKASRAALESAEAAVRIVELDIERLAIHAPFGGLLESDTAELGALLRPGDVCADIISLDPIKIVGFAPELDVDKIEVGMPATARLISGRRVNGQVSFVSRSADPTTRTFRVEVKVGNRDRSIRDGMTAEIFIPLDGEPGHAAPHAALTLDDEGRLGVRVVKDGIARFKPVEVLRDQPSGVFLGGLDEVEEIIIVGQEYVSDGRAVEVTHTEWEPGA